MGLFSTPRLAETKAYVAERDEKLWAPLLTSSGRKSSSTASQKSSNNALVSSSAVPLAAGPPDSLPAEEYELQHGDVDILGCKIEQLVSGIKEKKWNAERVMVAFIRSARRAHARTNCLTEVMFQEALDKARDLDAESAKTGELVGPLHGVPFSVKDHIQTKGVRTTLGFTAWIKSRPLAPEDASIVQIYSSLGAIPLCKTNIPQTMLSFECANPLWGRTSNPHNPAFTSGGSSGGEAALSASDGAAFGLGSDIGGSLRIPTGYCGIWAVKPTKGRFPTHGSAPFVEGQEGINVVFGPMTRSIADVELLTRVLVEALHPSPDVEGSPSPREVQRKFNTEYLRAQPLRVADFEPLKQAKAKGKPLRIGYYSFEGYSKPSPAILRAMDETIAALRKKYSDREVELVEVDYKLLRAKEALAIFLALTSADGFDQLIAPLQGDKMQPSLYLPILTARLPRPLLRLTGFLFRYIIRDNFLATATQRSGRKSAGEYFKAVGDKHRFTEEFDEKVWRHYELDAILCPIQPVPAIPHGAAAKLSPIAVSTILYNVMDSAVSIVPVTRVDTVKDSANEPAAGKASAEEVQKYKQWKENETFNKDSSHMVARTLYTEKKYIAEEMEGLPVCIQAVCRPHEEELAIGIAKLVDDALGPRGFGPGDYTRRHN